MKVVVFRNLHDQQLGLHALGGAAIPDDTLYFFPNILPGFVHTRGLREPIIVGLLDNYLYPYGLFKMLPEQVEKLHPQTRHLVEFSPQNRLWHDPGNGVPDYLRKFELQDILKAHV